MYLVSQNRVNHLVVFGWDPTHLRFLFLINFFTYSCIFLKLRDFVEFFFILLRPKAGASTTMFLETTVEKAIRLDLRGQPIWSLERMDTKVVSKNFFLQVNGLVTFWIFS